MEQGVLTHENLMSRLQKAFRRGGGSEDDEPDAPDEPSLAAA